MTPAWQRAYLRAAGAYLACRWAVMGGRVTGRTWGLRRRRGRKRELAGACLGLRDWAAELKLLVKEMRND